MKRDTVDPPGLELGALSNWFETNVPGCQGPLTARMLPGGRSNLTYLVTDGHARWVVRRPPLGVLTPSAHDVGREFRVISALRGSGVAVPRAVADCTEPEVIGAPFTVVTYVEGRVLRSRTDTAGHTPDELRRCAGGLVEQLARLHSVSYAEAGLSGWGRPEGYLRRQLDRWRNQWDLVATRQLPDLDRLHKALEIMCPKESRASIVHGDYRVDNTILDPGDLSRVRAVVDWELSTLGDPLADLGTFLAYRDPAVDPLLDSPAATDPGFPGPLELAEQYAVQSGRDLTLLRFYQSLAYFKIAVIAEGVYARHLQGDAIGKGSSRAGLPVPLLLQAGLALVRGHP